MAEYRPALSPIEEVDEEQIRREEEEIMNGTVGMSSTLINYVNAKIAERQRELDALDLDETEKNRLMDNLMKALKRGVELNNETFRTMNLDEASRSPLPDEQSYTTPTKPSNSFSTPVYSPGRLPLVQDELIAGMDFKRFFKIPDTVLDELDKFIPNINAFVGHSKKELKNASMIKDVPGTVSFAREMQKDIIYFLNLLLKEPERLQLVKDEMVDTKKRGGRKSKRRNRKRTKQRGCKRIRTRRK